MKISDLKETLMTLDTINFKLPDGTTIAPHFHVTEVGLVTKHFIDCGGAERKETVANFQLWEADDYEHLLTPQKFLNIINLSQKILKNEDLSIEVEYQQNTIGKFGLEFDGRHFVLTTKQTACLAEDACGIPEKKTASSDLQKQTSSCSPGKGCC